LAISFPVISNHPPPGRSQHGGRQPFDLCAIIQQQSLVRIRAVFPLKPTTSAETPASAGCAASCNQQS